MRVKYSTEFINEVLEHIHANGMSETAIKYHVSYGTLNRWNTMYEIHGSDAFTNMYQQSCTYDFQFKLNAVKYVLDKGFSIIYTACKFLINHITLRNWIKTYQEHGSKGLSVIKVRPHKQAFEPMKKNKNNLRRSRTVHQDKNVATDVNVANDSNISTVKNHVDASLTAMYEVDRIKKRIKEVTNDPELSEQTRQAMLSDLQQFLEITTRFSTSEMELAYRKKLKEIATTLIIK